MPDRSLRILHLAAGSDAGGLSRYIFDLCSAMHAQGHQVAVAGERGAWHWLFENALFPWIDVPLKGGPLELMTSARKLREWVSDHPVDLLHTHYRRPTLVARRLQESPGFPPIVYTLHLSHIALNWPWSWFTDFGDRTHVASDEAKRWVMEHAQVPSDRVTLIPHGIPIERFPLADEEAKRAARHAFGFSAHDVVAAYVGRLDDPKNEGWLLDLAASSRERLPHLRLVLAGQGPHESSLRQRIEREDLKERVFLLGHREPLPVYQAADALLLPSSREGFPYVTAEAMSVGVPVLRTRTSGTRGLIVEGVTGRSVPIEREAFIAGAVEFLSDTATLAEMGLAAAAHVREHFTFERQLEQTIALYRRLIESRGGASS